MGSDLTQISVMVPEDSKAEWKHAAEESDEYNSMSQLIRTAVGKEISGRYEGQGLERADLQEILDDRVGEDLKNVEVTLKSLQQKVGSIEEDTERLTKLGRNTRLEIYSAIPKGEINAIGLEELSQRLSDVFEPHDITIAAEEIEQIQTVGSDEGRKFYREE